MNVGLFQLQHLFQRLQYFGAKCEDHKSSLLLLPILCFLGREIIAVKLCFANEKSCLLHWRMIERKERESYS